MGEKNNRSSIELNEKDFQRKIDHKYDKTNVVWFIHPTEDADCDSIEKSIRNIKADIIISWNNFICQPYAFDMKKISLIDLILDQINDIEGVFCADYRWSAPP